MSEVFVEKQLPAIPRDRILSLLRSYLEGTDVIRAILFGSFARDQADAVSDVDLVLIEEAEAPFVERGSRHLPLFRLGFALDLLVYTPSEFERLKRDESPFIERVCREGMEI